MITKSSQIPPQNRKPKPARVPAKWRNLPPAGHGITLAMKTRPIIRSTPNEDPDYREFDDMVELMPVPIALFLEEHGFMILAGYHAVGQETCMIPCHICGSDEVIAIEYAKRHRNGKVNRDWKRDFNLCPQCMHVSEIAFTFRNADDAGREEDDSAA